ncbi:MAG: hypothetical protein Q8K00_00465 [Syntrophales bacterium]|nr:hypothetical protein [Syntrophales bacterium]
MLITKDKPKKWYSGHDLVKEWGIKGFELFNLMKNGLQAYTSTGKKVVDSDPLPRGKKQSLEQVEANQWAKWNAGSNGKPSGYEDKIKASARYIYNRQSLEILNPPKDCVLMSFTLPLNDERANAILSKILCLQFRSFDVVKFTNEYSKIQSLPSEESRNETADPQQQPERDFKGEANKIKDHEDFIRSLRVSYVSDTEVRIKVCNKKSKTYSYTDLGYERENTKEWLALIQILKSEDHLYHVGVAYGKSRQRNKTYDSNRNIHREISKKFVRFLNETYKQQLPANFQLFELKKSARSGTYGPKFAISILSVEAESNYSRYSKEKLLGEIEGLVSRRDNLRTYGDEDSENKLIDVIDKLNTAIAIAINNDWLDRNRSKSYLNPKED